MNCNRVIWKLELIKINKRESGNKFLIGWIYFLIRGEYVSVNILLIWNCLILSIIQAKRKYKPAWQVFISTSSLITVHQLGLDPYLGFISIHSRSKASITKYSQQILTFIIIFSRELQWIAHNIVRLGPLLTQSFISLASLSTSCGSASSTSSSPSAFAIG